MSGALVLSLFPGIGLLDRAFEEEGFCVVRGPDLLWGGDVRTFHPPAGAFAGVIGGPPCQHHSRLRLLTEHNGNRVAENLIPEFERCLTEASPLWFLMENVPGAPEPNVAGYLVRSLVVNNRWVAAAPEQNRRRRFSFGSRDGRSLHVDVALFENPCVEAAVLARGGGKPNRMGIRDNRSRAAVAESIRLQGLPADFLAGAPFTVEGMQAVVGNGVPMPLGRAIARAVKAALEPSEASA